MSKNLDKVLEVIDSVLAEEHCCVPECTQQSVYADLCVLHAEEEFGPANPTVEELVGPLW